MTREELVERGARHEERPADADPFELSLVDQAPDRLGMHAEELRDLADAGRPFRIDGAHT